MYLDVIIGVAGLLVSIAGLIYSFLAFIEARQAKVAANKAGQMAKRQSVAFEIAELCHKCKLNKDVTYTGVGDRYDEVNDGVQRIMGLYLENKDEIGNSILDGEVTKSLSEIKTQLNSLNPATSPDTQKADADFFYLIFSAPFSALSGALNKLQGIQQAQLIEK